MRRRAPEALSGPSCLDRSVLVHARHPAGRDDEGRLGQLEDDRARDLGSSGGLSPEDRRLDPLAAEMDSPGPFLDGCGGGSRLRRWARDNQRQVDIDEDNFALGVAVAIALLVQALEPSHQLVWVGIDTPGHRQLDGLSRIPQLVYDA